MLRKTIDPRPAEKLGSQVEQYLNAGGQIKTLPGPTLAPPPPRRHPKPLPKKPRRPLMEAHVARYQQYGPEIIEMRGSGMVIREIARNVRKSASFVTNCLAYFGVKDAQADKKARDQEEMIEQIRAMAGDGHSPRYISEQLHVTASTVLYHANKHEIGFRRE